MVTCKICGHQTDDSHLSNGPILKKYELCFDCNFWREQFEEDKKRGEHNWAIVNGEHYVLCPPTNSYFKGFGGRLFRFKFNDGTYKECNNVWYQGDLKEAHPHWMRPDNATIV